VSWVFKIANGFARRRWHLLSTCNLLASATKLAPGPFLCGSAAAGRSAIRIRTERGGEMFERFTDRARRIVVLAQDEARNLNHNYIGTEHLLLGLIREGAGVAAKALESLGISLEAVRHQVEAIIGQGQIPQQGHIPFTPRAKKVLELSLREADQLGHNYIGTEHILLGLIREGEGVAAQVLMKLGADLNRVRQQVIQLLHGYQGKEPASSAAAPGGLRRGRGPSDVPARVHALESRVAAIEQRVGTGPATDDLDEQIEQVRQDKQSAIDFQDSEQARSLRDRERQLLADKTARHNQWEASHPDLASLAEEVQRLSGEMERLRGLLRQHGTEPEDNTA
jgi:Clp amino terminal domain, pathogenicity island component